MGAFVPGKGTAEFGYDGLRNRVRKLENLQSGALETPDPCREIRYILDATLPYDNLLMTQGAQEQCFTWGNGLISTTGDHSFCYAQDHLGSPIRLLGEGQSSIPLSYDEFGMPVADNMVNRQSVNNPFGFTGYQYDDISGLYYAQARYYQPALGRFGAEDPAKDRRNWYGYCNANPLTFCDPLGLFCDEELPANFHALDGWLYGQLEHLNTFTDASVVKNWCDDIGTVIATLTANGMSTTARFTDGVDGTRIIGDRMYVDIRVLRNAFDDVLHPGVVHNPIRDGIILGLGIGTGIKAVPALARSALGIVVPAVAPFAHKVKDTVTSNWNNVKNGVKQAFGRAQSFFRLPHAKGFEGSSITPKKLSELANNSNKIDGYKNPVKFETVFNAAKEFTGSKFAKKVGNKWVFTSRCGLKEVRIMTKRQSGLYQANFETFDRSRRTLTNYHVNIID